MSSVDARLAAFVANAPYLKFLGMRVEMAGAEMTAILPFAPDLIGNTHLPALHGGAIGAFLEITALAQLAVIQDGPKSAKTIDVTIDYLRPGRAQTSYARAEVRKIGRTIASVHVEAWQDDRANPFAALRGHFLLSAGG